MPLVSVFYSPNLPRPLSVPERAVWGQLCHLEAGEEKRINERLMKRGRASFLPIYAAPSCLLHLLEFHQAAGTSTVGSYPPLLLLFRFWPRTSGAIFFPSYLPSSLLFSLSSFDELEIDLIRDWEVKPARPI